MLNTEKNITQIIKDYKINNKYIYILENDKKVGRLVPIGNKFFNSNEATKILKTWRENAINAYMDRTLPTIEGTLNWLNNSLINSENRILFFIENTEGIKLGHIGLYSFDYKSNSCEIDNVVRGVNIQKGIMTHALQSLIQWTKNDLQINNIYLRVFSNNEKAIKLYKNCGFVEDSKISLKEENRNGIVKYSETTKENINKSDIFFLKMKLK